ncbi:HD-GYP domain-containing protein [Deinococcus aluminii]
MAEEPDDRATHTWPGPGPSRLLAEVMCTGGERRQAMPASWEEELGSPAALETLVHLLAVSQEGWQAGHIHRVEYLAVRLAVAAGLPPEEVEAVRWGAALHDIGKARVPREILQKPGPLDPPEYAVILQHPVWGVELLADLPCLPLPTVDAVCCHHERWDGAGYPLGLQQQAIPLSARIVSVADVFDALTSARPYKAAWSCEKAALYLLEQSGQQFDPHLTRLFVVEVLGLGQLADHGGDPAIK